MDAQRLTGPVFALVNRHGQLRSTVTGDTAVAVRLHAGAVSLIVKTVKTRVRAALARRRPRPEPGELERIAAGFSGDSLRAGWQANRTKPLTSPLDDNHVDAGQAALVHKLGD